MSSLTHVTVRPLLLQSSSTFNKVVFGYENSSKGFGFKRTLEKILRNSRPAMGCFCEAIPNKGNLYKWNRVSGTLFINFFFNDLLKDSKLSKFYIFIYFWTNVNHYYEKENQDPHGHMSNKTNVTNFYCVTPTLDIFIILFILI